MTQNEADAKAAELLSRLPLPALVGSEKQIAWASKIRAAKINGLAVDVSEALLDDCAEALMGRIAAVVSETRSSWWIEHKDGGFRTLEAVRGRK